MTKAATFFLFHTVLVFISPPFIQGTGIYGATAQADLSESEFRAHFLGLDRARDDPDVHWPPADIPDVELPSEFDWRTKVAITPVKNQVADDLF